MGKNPFSFRRTISRRRNIQRVPANTSPQNSLIEIASARKSDDAARSSVAPATSTAIKGKKKMGGAARLWMKFDKCGESELMEWDKSTIIKRVGIPARDLRILGPVFSHCSSILERKESVYLLLRIHKGKHVHEKAATYNLGQARKKREDYLPRCTQHTSKTCLIISRLTDAPLGDVWFNPMERNGMNKGKEMERKGKPSDFLNCLAEKKKGFQSPLHSFARERAMVINLEFIKAIVTAEEVFLVDPLRQEVLPFVDQLRQQLPRKSHTAETVEGEQQELPFEFQVLEIALEVVCSYLDSNVSELEKHAYPVLDELTRNVSTKNLERVRTLKSTLTRLLARVQKVRDEIEHLLDDNDDMAHLYLSRKMIQYQQSEALLNSGTLNSIVPHALHRNSSHRSGSIMTNNCWDEDVEDLEMLLEAYFMQLDGTRNKILSVREYIDDTEDYVNIQLDNHRNELIQLQLNLTIASFAIAVDTLIAGVFGMNIPCSLYNINGIFGYVIGGATAFSFVVYFLILGYARWKKLLGS